MSNVIIDPMWFYWIQVVDAIKTLLAVISVIGMGTMTGMALINFFEENKKLVKRYICTVVLFTILLTVALLIPERKTLIQMKIAEYATYENVDFVIEKITDVAEKE